MEDVWQLLTMFLIGMGAQAVFGSAWYPLRTLREALKRISNWIDNQS